MEIKKCKTLYGYPSIAFTSSRGDFLLLWTRENGKDIEIGTHDGIGDNYDDIARFSQEDIKSLLPYLQAFAETGTLEPLQDTTLQGRLLAHTIIDVQAKNIRDLKQLVRGWKSFAGDLIYMMDDSMDEESPDYQDLANRTSNLLGEEYDPPCSAGLAEAFQPENLIRVSADQNCKIYEQERRIKALESLLRYWKSSWQSPFGSKSFDQLIHETEELLGEENDPTS